MDPYLSDMQWSVKKNMIPSSWFCKCFTSVVHNLFGKLNHLTTKIWSMSFSKLLHVGMQHQHQVALFEISDTFPDHLGDVSQKQSEHFHKDFKIKEDRYQGWRDTHMIADYCWSLKWDCPSKSHDRKSLKHKFLSFVNHILLKLLKTIQNGFLFLLCLNTIQIWFENL